MREAHRHRIEAGHGGAFIDVQLHDGIEHPRAVQMRAQAARVGKFRDLPQIIRLQHPAADRIFERQQPRAREMDIVGFDGIGDALNRDAAVRLILERLRLNAAEHRGTAALVLVGVGLLTHQVFVAAAAMRHQRGQIALRAAGEEQGTLESETFGDQRLQAIDGGIVAIDIVAHFRRRHGGAHSR